METTEPTELFFYQSHTIPGHIEHNQFFKLHIILSDAPKLAVVSEQGQHVCAPPLLVHSNTVKPSGLLEHLLKKVKAIETFSISLKMPLRKWRQRYATYPRFDQRRSVGGFA